MDKYVKLVEGRRWGKDGWTIKSGETKQCPDDIYQQGKRHLQVVSKPRVLRKVVKKKAVENNAYNSWKD